MGHVSVDAYLGPGGPAAAAGAAGGVALTPAGPRQLEAVRRGAVRERKPGQKVVPSAWEHLEMALGDGPDRVSSLVLRPGGTFLAEVKEQEDDADGDPQTAILSSASGSWRQCRGGVELVFRETPELDLPELLLAYVLRRGCLVAEALELPDGLAQEYSRCPDASPATGIAAERLSLIDRMLADAAASAGGSSPSSPLRSPAATAVGAPALRAPRQGCDSDSDECLEGTAPLIIADGSDSEAEGSTGGSTPRRRAVQATHCSLATPGVNKDYIDDFEGESDDGSVEAA